MNRTALVGVLVSSAVLVGCSAGHGEYTEAFRKNAVTRMDQVRSATQYDMAQQQYLAGDLKKALRTIEQSIALKDDVAKSHLLRGRIQLEMGQLDSALDSFNNTLLIDEEFAKAHYFRGIIHERFNRTEDAVDSFRTAHQLDRTDPQFVVALVEMFIEQGKLSDAEIMLERAKTQFELNPAIHQTLGHIALMQGDTEKAVKSFGEAHLLASGDDGILEDLSRAQLAAGRYAEAEYSLSRLIAKKDNESRRDLRLLQARAFAELDRPVEARTVLRNLLRQSGGANDVKAWIELGNVAWILGDNRELREAGTRLSTIAPNRYEGQYLLGLFNMREGNLERSAQHLIRAVESAPEEATPALMLGVVFEHMGQHENANEFFKTALRLNPEDPRALALYEHSGSRFDASAALATVSEDNE